MMLMFSLLLFVIFVSRFLSDRNRVQAASRTQAWMHAYRADYTDDDTTEMTGGDMHMLFRRWFFKEHGPAAGVVVLNDPREGNGIFYGGSGEGTLDVLQHSIETMLNGEANKSNRGELGSDDARTDSESDSSEYATAGKMLVRVMSSVVTGFLNFLTRDFKYYEAEVSYGMPLVFPLAFYELFWAQTFSEPVSIENEEQAAQANPNMTYVFYNTDYTQGCVFPNMNTSTYDALEELNEYLAGIFSLLESAMNMGGNPRDRLPLYRPHTNAVRDPNDRLEKTENRLSALMVYEYMGYDPKHKYAKKRGSPKPWWR
jgi:hypothetical protein